MIRFQMKLFILMILFSVSFIYAQTDRTRWSKADFSYAVPDRFEHRDYSLEDLSAGNLVLKTAADAYWYLISDADGDNCAFSPTCSNFFLQSVKATNLAQGTLMFFDRFTRDMNIFKLGHYPRVPDGHFYDPPSLYSLNPKKIVYIPSSYVVNGE